MGNGHGTEVREQDPGGMETEGFGSSLQEDCEGVYALVEELHAEGEVDEDADGEDGASLHGDGDGGDGEDAVDRECGESGTDDMKMISEDVD